MDLPCRNWLITAMMLACGCGRLEDVRGAATAVASTFPAERVMASTRGPHVLVITVVNLDLRATSDSELAQVALRIARHAFLALPDSGRYSHIWVLLQSEERSGPVAVSRPLGSYRFAMRELSAPS